MTEENCILSVNEVDVVAVPDKPGGLAEVIQKLSDAQIGIEYMNSLIDRGTDYVLWYSVCLAKSICSMCFRPTVL